MGLFHPKKTTLALALFLSVLLTGCTTSPTIFTHHEKSIDFNQYQSFSFYDPIVDKKQAYSTLLDKYIQTSIAKELERRGLKQVFKGDLKISFNIHTKERSQTTITPAMHGGYYNYRGRYGYSYGMGYGSETRISQYTEGTLNIDVVDRRKKQVIWEGAAVGRLKDQVPNDVEKLINEVVASILADYPIRSK
jgi:hypothetical protein